MTVLKLLHIEVEGFLFALAAIIAYRMLTRQISVRGLLQRGDGGVSPERVQLLMATLVVSFKLITDVVHSTNGVMPDVSKEYLYLIGGSSGLYATVKAAITMNSGPTGSKN